MNVEWLYGLIAVLFQFKKTTIQLICLFAEKFWRS